MPATATIDPTGQWEMIAISTLEKYLEGGELHDQVFSKEPALDWINANGLIQKVQGGSQIVLNLETAKNDTFQHYAGYGTLPTRPQKGAAQARYDWVEWAIGLSISGREKALNRGETELFSLIKQKVNNANKSLKENINTLLINGDGSLDDNGYPTMMGLETLIGDHRSAITVIGGINSVDNEYWRSPVYRPNDADWTALTTNDDKLVLSTRLIDAMFDTLEETTTSGKPDMVLTTRTLLRDFIQQLKSENQPVYTDTSLTLRTGTDNVVYRGVPFMCDKNVQTGRMYFPSKDALSIQAMPDVWFSQTAWQKPYDQNAMYAHILGMGQMVAHERRACGKIEDLVPATD